MHYVLTIDSLKGMLIAGLVIEGLVLWAILLLDDRISIARVAGWFQGLFLVAGAVGLIGLISGTFSESVLMAIFFISMLNLIIGAFLTTVVNYRRNPESYPLLHRLIKTKR